MRLSEGFMGETSEAILGEICEDTFGRYYEKSLESFLKEFQNKNMKFREKSPNKYLENFF